MNEDAIRKAFAELRARVASLEAASGLFASDRDLDGQYGDPKIKFAPRDWRGSNYVGKPMSQCVPDFLEMLAESLSYAADHPREGKEKYASFNRKDAARARSWARRLRSGAVPPPPAARALAGEPADSGEVQAPSIEVPTFEVPVFDEPVFDIPDEDDLPFS